MDPENWTYSESFNKWYAEVYNPEGKVSMHVVVSDSEGIYIAPMTDERTYLYPVEADRLAMLLSEAVKEMRSR